MKRKFSPWILEAWATWEVLRRLGFSSDHIFWEFSNTVNSIPTPGLTLNIVVRAQGKTFTVTCSHRLSEREARRLKLDAVDFQEKCIAREFDDAEMTQILLASRAWKHKSALILTLHSKGFETHPEYTSPSLLKSN